MADNIMTDADLQQLNKIGISPDQVRIQVALLKSGLPPLRLNRPATHGDGIVVISEAEQAELVKLHDAAAGRGRFMKFVPASGAASRMFINWQSVLARGGFDGATGEAEFADNLPKFAFFPELKTVIARQGENIEALLKTGNLRQILHYLLTPRGLNYGRLPKALLKFHTYEHDRQRTAIEEHLVEAALYTADNRKECRLHFTVSEEHLSVISPFLEEIRPGYEQQFGVKFHSGLSCQSGASNTVALEGQELYRDGAGRLILRPGGHGALLSNLQALDGDIVFIKNIDNVAPDRLKPVIILHKKILGGYFIRLEEAIFRHLRNLTGGDIAEEQVREALLFCRQKLQWDLPLAFTGSSPPQQREAIIQKLNRPLRVCGMVINEGEPGGGPFWIDGQEGQSLQIVEAQQIDADSTQQQAVWSAATHFNPVDLVCGLRGYRAQKFDLPRFSDPQTATLTKKTEGVRKITVLEHPGLWNGSMARWNTVFVEVPIATFNPVKTIADLLRPQHLPEG
jgi:hypothetical protein